MRFSKELKKNGYIATSKYNERKANTNIKKRKREIYDICLMCTEENCKGNCSKIKGKKYYG